MPGLNQSPLNSEQVVQGLDQLGAGSLQEQAIHKLLRTLSQNVIIHRRLSQKPSARIFQIFTEFSEARSEDCHWNNYPSKEYS